MIRNDGEAKLYLDGRLQATIAGRGQTFTWNPSKTLVMLGLHYVGFQDDLARFNRALTESEIRTLHELKEGVRMLH